MIIGISLNLLLILFFHCTFSNSFILILLNFFIFILFRLVVSGVMMIIFVLIRASSIASSISFSILFGFGLIFIRISIGSSSMAIYSSIRSSSSSDSQSIGSCWQEPSLNRIFMTTVLIFHLIII